MNPCPASGTFARPRDVNQTTLLTGCPLCGRHVLTRRIRKYYEIPRHQTPIREGTLVPTLSSGVDEAVK